MWLINILPELLRRIEGMGLDEIARETLAKHFFAFQQKRNSC